MVTQVRVRAGQARPLTNTAASQTLARSDREIGGSKMGPLKKSRGSIFVFGPACVSAAKCKKKLPRVLLVENVTV